VTPAAYSVAETALPLADAPVPKVVGVVTTPAAVFVNDAVAEYDARTLEAADSASATGQTVYIR
jgi:3-polyprenyl-4-hydroxybenzoate decarboxylase